MSEDNLKRKCVKIAKKIQNDYAPNFWFYCPTDRFYSGIPDILMCWKGRWGAVELKTERGKVTPIQEHTLKTLDSAGCMTSVCRSGQEFYIFLMTLIQKEGGTPNAYTSENGA